MLLPGTFSGFLSLQSHHGCPPRGLVTSELPMSEVTHSPLPPSKTLEEQAAEILALLEQIISTSPEMEKEEKIPA
jgi:hypothetical protein